MTTNPCETRAETQPIQMSAWPKPRGCRELAGPVLSRTSGRSGLFCHLLVCAQRRIALARCV